VKGRVPERRAGKKREKREEEGLEFRKKPALELASSR